MHTNGPDQRDCGACGKPLGNRIRITLVDGMVVGMCCHRLEGSGWSPSSHLEALTDRPAPTSGKIIPGKSRRIKRK